MKTEAQKLGTIIVDILTTLDDSRCYARCEHGGACALEIGHDGDHDADGLCQWSQEG